MTGIGRAFKNRPPFGKSSDPTLKIGVVVEEYCNTWSIDLPSLGYKLLQIHTPEIFSKLLPGGTLIGAECLPP